ncbi:MAG: DUF3365 domain-containing protein [Bdellovibrionales bacterium]|nr:DUF3365 domain-containing protein [Bdellovibrionales bacterium]
MFPSRAIAFCCFVALPMFVARHVQGETDRSIDEQVVTLGNNAADAILKTFISSLQGAIQQGGVLHAVSFCNTEIPAITKTVKKSLPEGLQIKRTTLKVRNPLNTPDELESQALRYFTQEFKRTGTYPLSHIQTIEGGYRFYKPLLIAKPCLSCHGPKTEMSPELQTLINEKYPTDQATDYQEGELRGLLRIEIPRSSLDNKS